MRSPLAVFVTTTPVWNVPPLFNLSAYLATRGYRVLVLGYRAEGLPARQRISKNAQILRVAVRSRKIRFGAVRKLAALIEFLGIARNLVKRLEPEVVITFSDPASILLSAIPGKSTKLAWLLEYPEFELVSFPEKCLYAVSSKCWNRADALVTPTAERLERHLDLRPECKHMPSFVVANAPPQIGERHDAEDTSSPETETAIDALDTAAGSGLLRVIYAGGIGNRYAIDRLIYAVDQCPPVFLLLLGKKHDLSRKEVTEALSRCRNPERIVWVDEAPYRELQSILAHADVGFATYLGDTINTRFSAPGKLYEFLKAGLVVLSDTECCIHREIESASCGRLFQYPATTEGICEQLEKIRGNPDKVPEQKKRSRQLFEESLCLEQQMIPVLRFLSALKRSKPEKTE